MLGVTIADVPNLALSEAQRKFEAEK